MALEPFRTPVADQARAQSARVAPVVQAGPAPAPDRSGSVWARAGDWLADNLANSDGVSGDIASNAASGAFTSDAATNQGWMDRAGSLLERGAAGVDQGIYRFLAGATGSERAAALAGQLDGTVGQDVAGATSWEQYKAGQGGLLDYAGDALTESAPSMLGLVTLPSALITGASLTGNVAGDRARNDGRTDISLADIGYSAPAAAASTALDRFGLGKITGSGTGGFLRRLLVGAGAEGGTEFAQGIIENAGGSVGTEAGFDPLQALDQGVAGAIPGFIMGGGVQAGRSVYDRVMPARQIAPGAEGDGLQDVSLDGGPAGPVGPAGGLDVAGTLASVGMAPEQFSSPEVAVAMAERVAAARNRTINVPANELQQRAAMDEAIASGETNPAFALDPMRPRTVPDDVTMQAFPEGTVRSDEAGSLIGLLRNLAGNQNVVEQAQARAAENPALQAILDANIETQRKIGPLWERLQAMQQQQPPAPGLATDPANQQPPQQRPTVEQARGATEGVGLPVAGRITSRMGNRSAPTAGASTNHRGIDIAAPRGSSVAAPSGGTVIMAGEAGANGNLVRVDHGNGVISSYAHLDSVNVRIGQQINPGDELGKVGSTGRSTGNHLHYQIMENGQPVDPETYRFQQAPAAEPTWRVGDQGADPFDQAQGPGERMARPTSPTEEELAAGRVYRDRRSGIFYDRNGVGRDMWEGPMATEGNRPFKDVTGEQDRPESRAPEGQPPPPPGGPAPDGPAPRTGQSFFEDDLNARMDDMMREYEASQSRRRERQQEQRNQQRGPDPKETHSKYGQKPHQEGDFWRQTDDGIVADKNGNPVAFRSAKEAAKWATQNKMAGDFELESWGTNTGRVILRRRANSSYGTAKPGLDPAAGPVEPPAGRSADGSQRMIPGTAPDGETQPSPEPSETGGDTGPQAGVAAPLDESTARYQEQYDSPTTREEARQIHVGEGDPEAEQFLDGWEAGRRGDPAPPIDTPEHDGWYTGNTTFKRKGPLRRTRTDGPSGTEYMQPDNLQPSEASMNMVASMRKANREGAMIGKKSSEEDAREFALGLDAAHRGDPLEDNAYVMFQHGYHMGKPSKPPVQGKRETVVTPAGREVETQFEVRELGDLQQASGVRQPRNRNRDASDVQVNDIAANLDPQQLASNRQAAHGAPIIGPDGVIEVGNGRTRALERAYATNPAGADAYRQMIRDQGLDIEGFERPVLVRKRLTYIPDADMSTWVNEAQDSGTMKYSAPEQARADAAAISDETLQLYRGYEVTAAGNREFVKAWMTETRADANSVQASDGTLSTDGERRVRASILAKAFADETLIGKLLGDSDNNIKAIGNVLLDAAPKFAQVAAAAKDGAISAKFDIGSKVAEMAGLISRARADGMKLVDLLGQSDMFGKNVDAETESLVRLMFKDDELTRPRSQVRLKEGFDFYLEGALATKDGVGMFGEALRPVDVLEAARTRLDARDNPGEQTGMFKVISEKLRAAQIQLSNIPLKARLRSIRADLDPDQRELVDRLLEAIGDDARLTFGFLGDKGGKTIAGQADIGENRVYVADSRDVETLLHETVHLALIARYGEEFSELQAGDAASAPAMELVRLFNDARARHAKYGFWNRKAAGHTVDYALSNIDEFVAEAMSSAKFQRWLQRGTMWERMVDTFRKALGLPVRFKPMLDDAMRAGRNLLEGAATDPGRNVQARVFGRKGLAHKLVDKDGLTRDVAAIKAAVGNPGDTLKAMGRRVQDGVSWLMYSSDQRGRVVADRIESEAAHELLDHFLARPGMLEKDGLNRTFHEAVQRFGAGRSQAAFRALDGILDNPASERRVADLLRFPNKTVRATPAELAAAKEVRALLKETIDYRKAAGEELGEVSDGYFPRWLDVDKVMERQDDFKQAAAKLYRDQGMSDKEAKEAAQRWLEHTIDTYAGLDAGLDMYNVAGDVVGSRTSKGREFGKQADKILADFYQDDLLPVLSQYFHGSARRAEMMRRFGKKGAVGSPERAKWEKEHGDKTQLDVLEDRVREDARAHGADGAGAMGVLRDIYGSNLGRVSAGMSIRMRQTVAWAHTWTQLGVMDRATITSLAEMMGGFTRGGPGSGIPFIVETAKQYVRQLKGASPDDAQRWAEALGVAEDAIVNTALTARANIEGGTAKSQKVLQGFYQATTLHQYTEATRIAGVKMARGLLDVWSHDMDSSNARVRNRARGYLAEAGVRDPAAFAKRLREGGWALEDVSRETSEGARDYATAVIRITNQAIMRPTRAEKPVWANHPVGGMFFSLMSYSYGFKKQVLDRTGRLAVQAWKDKDPTLLAPAMGLAMMGAVQWLLDSYVRPTIFGGGPPEDESTLEASIRVADRAGLTGGLSPIVNAFTGVRYRRSLIESLAGPVLGRPADMATKLAELSLNNSGNTNTTERNAAGAVYDNMIEPAIDGLAAARLFGGLRTGVVMGTGTRTDEGLMPSDREFFVSAVAGKKRGN